MKRKSLGCLTAMVILSGCASLQPSPSTQSPDFTALVKSLGDNAKSASNSVKVLITEVNSTQLSADITDLAAKGRQAKDPLFPSKRLIGDDLALKSIPTNSNGGNGNSYFVAGQFESNAEMTNGLNILNAYGTALSNLAVAGSRKDMQLASANLYAAAVKLDDNYQSLSGGAVSADTKNVAAIVSTAIAEIGTIYNAHKRDAALRKIINGAEPKIKVICSTLSNGIKPDNFGLLISLNRQRILKANIVEYNFYIDSNPTTLAWREGEIKRLITLQSDYDSSAESTVKASKAIAAVGEAHTALVKAVNENNIGNKDLFQKLQTLKSLTDNAKSYKDMLLKCESGKFKADDSGSVTCQDAS